jgi:hypothetical protein
MYSPYIDPIILELDSENSFFKKKLEDNSLTPLFYSVIDINERNLMNPEASEYIQMKKKFSNVITKDYFHN